MKKILFNKEYIFLKKSKKTKNAYFIYKYTQIEERRKIVYNISSPHSRHTNGYSPNYFEKIYECLQNLVVATAKLVCTNLRIINVCMRFNNIYVFYLNLYIFNEKSDLFLVTNFNMEFFLPLYYMPVKRVKCFRIYW